MRDRGHLKFLLKLVELSLEQMSQNKYIPVPNVMIPLHEMQGQIKHEICLVLDANSVWIELAALMQFDFQTINVS